MLNKYVILHNPYDKQSREFVAQYPGEQIISWYDNHDQLFQDYHSKNLPHPSRFPSVVDTELKMMVDLPATLQTAKDYFIVIETKKNDNLERIRNRLVQIRTERDQLLAETDWLMVVDSPASDDCVESYKEYRQLLRELPEHIADVDSIVWPTKPAYTAKV
jgi:hypothetical protein